MILRYHTLYERCQELNRELKPSCFVQKIFSTAHYLCFALRLPGKTLWLYLGRGGIYQELFLTPLAPPSAFRLQDQALDYWRKHLHGPVALHFSMDDQDRIVRLQVRGLQDQLQNFYIFWKRAGFYLLHQIGPEAAIEHCYASWLKKATLANLLQERNSDLFFIFQTVGRKKLAQLRLNEGTTGPTDESPEQRQERLEKYFNTMGLQVTERTGKKKDDRLERKIKHIQQDLNKLALFEPLKAYLDAYPLEIPAKIKLSTESEYQLKLPVTCITVEQRRNYLYQKMKNFRLNYEQAKERLRACYLERALKPQSEDKQDKNNIPSTQRKIAIPVIPMISINQEALETGKVHSSPMVNKEQSQLFDEYLVPNLGVMRLGKNAQGNDYLRSKWASKEDWWFHLQKSPSAHGYFKPDPQAPRALTLNVQELQLLGNIFLLHLLREKIMFLNEQLQIPDRLKGMNEDLIFTQVKHLKAVKGTPGLVRYSKEKSLRLYL